MVRKLPPNEKGVRTLEQMLAHLVSKVSFLYHHKSQIPTSFSTNIVSVLPVTMTLSLLELLLKNWDKKCHPSQDSSICMFL